VRKSCGGAALQSALRGVRGTAALASL